MATLRLWSSSRLCIRSDFFNIFGNTYFASYADDNTIYKKCDNADDVLTYLQQSSKKLCKWLSDNEMKEITKKCHLVMSSNDSIDILIRNLLIKRSICEKLIVTKMVTSKNFAEKLIINLEH